MNTQRMAIEYRISETELAAVLLFLHTNNKSFAWTNTLGITNLSPNKAILGAQFFNQQKIKDTIYFINKEIERQTNNFDTETEPERKVDKVNLDQDIEITSDNIKQILQSEFQSIKDPDKRAVILMKIADFVGLKNSDQDDPLTPTIYLPARCGQCNQLTIKT